MLDQNLNPPPSNPPIAPGWQNQLNPFKLEWMEKYAQKNPGIKILDLGAGAGWYSLYLAEQGLAVTSVDAQLREFSHPRIRKREQSLEEKLPFENEEFHLILAWDIIEHVENESLLLSEIHRVLKKGGTVLLSVPHGNDDLMAPYYLTYAHYKDKTHFREYRPQDLLEKLEAHQLKKLRMELVGGNIYPYVILGFIKSRWVRFFTKVYIWVLKKLGFLRLENCHGDIFAVFEKEKV